MGKCDDEMSDEVAMAVDSQTIATASFTTLSLLLHKAYLLGPHLERKQIVDVLAGIAFFLCSQVRFRDQLYDATVLKIYGFKAGLATISDC